MLKMHAVGSVSAVYDSQKLGTIVSLIIESRKYTLGRNKVLSMHVKISNQINESTSDKYVLILEWKSCK